MIKEKRSSEIFRG